MLVLIFGIQFLISAVRYKYFDRYTLMLVPAAVIVILSLLREDKIKTGLISTLLFFAVFSVFGTIDYMQWNRAKWKLGNALIEKGFEPSEIANGFDWGGWYTFEKNMQELKKRKPVELIGEWDWQGLNNYKALISFNDKYNPEFKAGEEKYFSALSFKKESVYAWRIN